MLGENISNFFKEIGEILKKIFTSRVIPFVIFAMALFSVLIYRLFVLQIINGESYEASYTMKTERTVTTTGTRGNIYDSNGVLLAYSELAYSVVIEDSGYYSSTKVKNAALNKIIADTIDIIESNGDSIDMDFEIEYKTDGQYAYKLSDNALLRFLRDVYGHSAISELKEEERDATANETVEYLMKRYKINQPVEDSDATEAELAVYDEETALKIIYVRYCLSANSYQRYISFTLAKNISPKTMASILENSDTLTGVTIEEDSIRKYNYGTYIAHIVGYTGKISSTELDTLTTENPDANYDSNDVIGKSGVESAYETTLAGTKGSETMLVDSVGRVLEVTNSLPATVGSDVYLTIDVELQKKIYDLLERRLAETLVSRIVNSDSATYEETVVIPISQVVFALINNNLIDMEKIASSDSASAVNVYNIFSSQKAGILANIKDELNAGTPYSSLSSEMQSYIKLVRSNLINNDILNSDKISSSDELSKQWTAGSISLREYLEGAIGNGWINIYNLDVSSEYPTTEEVIECINAEALKEIEADSDLDKLIYKTLITTHVIDGRDICLILMEQNCINYTETEYVTISNGGSVFNFLVDKIKNLDITPAQLALDPCSGSCVVEDPNTGDVLAMVSYPSYDINYFSGSIDSDYYAALLSDKSTPLVNRATQTKIAPGSTFKPLISVAALAEGVVSSSESVKCDGIFDKVTPGIKCAVYPGEHGNLDLEGALEHSCNDYFCEMGYRLSITPSGTISFDYGLQRIQKYAELLGLSTKTGIQISETTPHVSDYNPVASAIGQGTNAYTSLNMARYISTVANSGTVYNSSIISKVVNNTTDDVTTIEPVVANTVDVDSSIWTTVHNGMQRVISRGIMYKVTDSLPVTVYGKSGTAEEAKGRANHACYVMFSTDVNDNPEIAVSVMIPYGYAATNAGIMAYYAMAAYYDSEIPSSVSFALDSQMIVED